MAIQNDDFFSDQNFQSSLGEPSHNNDFSSSNSSSEDNPNGSYEKKNSNSSRPSENSRKDSFHEEMDIPRLILVDMSHNDVQQLLPHIPEATGLIIKIAKLTFIEKLMPILQEKIGSSFFSRFFIFFLTTIIVIFNGQSIKFLWIDNEGWPIPLWVLILVGYGVIWLIDFPISELIRDFKMLKLQEDQQEWLNQLKFSNCDDHPLQNKFNQILDENFSSFILPYKKRKLWFLYIALLLVILVGEALVSLYLLSIYKENFPWWLCLTPAFSGALNILTGVIKGVYIKYPQELNKVKSKLNESKFSPLY